MDAYMGVDVGSVTTKFAVLDGSFNLIAHLYTRTLGRPIEATQRGLEQVATKLPPGVRIRGVCATGSARYLTGVIVGADVVKNEITAQAVGASHFVPDVRTVFEIGGQDSKIIILRDGVAVDFAMNTVCAAGTGSFLDHQALRLSIPIEEFGRIALQSRTPVRIAGRCTVFAETDMVHKQQMGHRVEDILYGLCQAMARNYLNNIAQGKEILAPVVFQGGVAYNQGMVRAFEEALGMEIIVPPHHEIMGAIGAAILASEHASQNGDSTKFKGFEAAHIDYRTFSFECKSCPNLCEIVQIKMQSQTIARWGGRCNRWDM